MAVRDNVNRIRENIHTDIPSQFPAIYREDGALLVEFVEAYYRYVDEQLPKFRDAFYARNVDTTDYDKFLLFFKNKYMSGFPLEGAIDTRFIIKHITDFYRRKGTEESLRLLFRMFFDEEVEIFYPASAIIKPSDSVWGLNTYLEMKPVKSTFDYPIKRGVKLRGDTSKAEAFVDEVIFKNFNGAIVPVVFISTVNGAFISDDGLISISGDTVISVGKTIVGNISKLEVQEASRLAYNNVGDEVLIQSEEFGVLAKGIVQKISETATGIIDFKVVDPGYGYAYSKDGVVDMDLNEHFISNQVLVTDASSNYDIQPFDEIEFDNVEVRNISNGLETPGYSAFTSTTQVLAVEGTLVFCLSPDSSIPKIPLETYIDGVNTRTGETLRFIQTAAFKNEASFKVQTLKNTETVKLIPDTIGPFEDVVLDSGPGTDYGMSGSIEPETLDTRIKDAFDVNEWVIGEIDKILVFDSGNEYRNDVVSIVRQPEITQFDHRIVGLTFDKTDFLLQTGEYITQVIQVENLDYDPDLPVPGDEFVDYTAKLQFVKRVEDVFYFKPKSFYQVDIDEPITIKGDTYTVVRYVEDYTQRPMGSNGLITGDAFFAEGQVEEIKVTETGYKYRDGEIVNIVNDNPDSVNYGKVVAKAEIETRGMGFTAGQWLTSTSFLNDPTKVIRDNYYYQEYSFDVLSIVNPDSYEDLVKNEVAPAGTMLFSSPLINSFNIIDTSVDVSMEIYGNDEIMYAQTNDEPDAIIQAEVRLDETGEVTNVVSFPVVQRDLWAKKDTLLVDETEALNIQINS